jgi:hypothetical protein
MARDELARGEREVAARDPKSRYLRWFAADRVIITVTQLGHLLNPPAKLPVSGGSWYNEQFGALHHALREGDPSPPRDLAPILKADCRRTGFPLPLSVEDDPLAALIWLDEQFRIQRVAENPSTAPVKLNAGLESMLRTFRQRLDNP